MRYYSTASPRRWLATVAAEDADETAMKEADDNYKRLQSILSEGFRAENLLVLLGSGASFCASNPPGSRGAPSMADLWDEAERQQPDFQDVLTSCRYDVGAHGDKNIEALLSQCKLALDYGGGGRAELIAAFVEATEGLIADRCSFVCDDTDLTVHQAFLKRIASRSVRQARAKVFTTNYDLCVETAASRAGFVAVDGFSYSLPRRFDSSYFAYDFVRRDGYTERPEFVRETLIYSPAGVP
jgi:hypothetical protein